MKAKFSTSWDLTFWQFGVSVGYIPKYSFEIGGEAVSLPGEIWVSLHIGPFTFSLELSYGE